MMEWLSDTILMTTLLMLLVLLVRRPVAQALGPSVAYWLWLLPAARLFMPSIEKTIEAPAAATALPAGNLPEASSMMADITAGAALPAAASSVDWVGIGITLWLGGAALLFILQMIRYSDMRDQLLGDAEDMGEIDGVRLISSDRVTGPLAFGLLRRFIAVPENFTSHFAEEEAALAIEHELSHHKSGDLLINLLAFIVLCLNWFNPIAWFAWRAFRLDQEAACDARVLSGKDEGTRETYGRTLARAAHEDLPTFATALNSPKTVIERLKRLAMNNDDKSRRIAGRIGIFAAIGVALPMTATVVPVWAHDPAKDHAQHDEAKKHGKHDEDMHVIMLDAEKGKKNAKTKFYTKTIKKDGKTITVKSTKKIDDKKIEKMIEEAEKERAKALKEAEDAEQIRVEIRQEVEARDAEKRKVIIRKKKAAALKEARAARRTALAVTPPAPPQRLAHPAALSALASVTVPEIRIGEIAGECKAGKQRHISRSYRNHGGQNYAAVSIHLCGKAEVMKARKAALDSLREACDDLKDDRSLPEKVRREVEKKLENNIRRLERDLIA